MNTSLEAGKQYQFTYTVSARSGRSLLASDLLRMKSTLGIAGVKGGVQVLDVQRTMGINARGVVIQQLVVTGIIRPTIADPTLRVKVTETRDRPLRSLRGSIQLTEVNNVTNLNNS